MKLKAWNEVEAGMILQPIKGDPHGGADILPEKRHYTEDSNYTHSVAYWRVDKPVYNSETCINCLFCWVYCPDTSILAREGNMKGIDYNHCKGCGICAEVCPSNPKSLIMFEDMVDAKDALAKWPAKEKKK